MDKFSLEIVTPIKDFKIEDIDYLRCPGMDGEFGIMNEHINGIFGLAVGELKILTKDKNKYYATGGGFLEIMGDRVKLLLESIEKSSDIDTQRANNSLERAKLRKAKKESSLNHKRAELSLVRALNRLKVSKR